MTKVIRGTIEGGPEVESGRKTFVISRKQDGLDRETTCRCRHDFDPGCLTQGQAVYLYGNFRGASFLVTKVCPVPV